MLDCERNLSGATDVQRNHTIDCRIPPESSRLFGGGALFLPVGRHPVAVIPKHPGLEISVWEELAMDTHEDGVLIRD